VKTRVLEASKVGPLLREWRRRRRLSQLELAVEAGISARHLSFVETGRARPRAEMVLHLAEHLDVPLRERNRLLLAAGYAPAFAQFDLDEPEMTPVRTAVRHILDAHEPAPAVVIDGSWEMIAANHAVALLTEGVAPKLLEPPVNVLRLSLHPQGLAPRIANLSQWRTHVLARLERQIALSGSQALHALHEELRAYPADDNGQIQDSGIAVPLRLRTDRGELVFISTVATFGTAFEITASELSIESFFPADQPTSEALRSFVADGPAT
jgi:transcriptional regulator with XRE-family HTH domain